MSESASSSVGLKPRLLLLLCAAWVFLAGYQHRQIEWSFSDSLHNLQEKRKGNLKDPDVWIYDVSELLHEYEISAPIEIALPPMYSEGERGNPDYMLGMTRYRSVMLTRGPFPHPKLSIKSNEPKFAFDNRGANAGLAFTELGQLSWPIGYTAFVDFITNSLPGVIDTPYLITEDGRSVAPVAVTMSSPSNHVKLGARRTEYVMRRWEPVVWEFPESGELAPGFSRYAVEGDGRRVSFVPALPTANVYVFGLFLLQDVIAQKPKNPPAWWEIDRKLRVAVVQGAGPAVTEPLYERLARLYPSHPLLAHYRVIASMHGPRFNERWLDLERRSCYLPLWNLLPLTDVTWEDVTKLPCYASRTSSVAAIREHVLGVMLLKFWRDRDRPELKDIAQELMRPTFLTRDEPLFAYAYSDLAYLWSRRSGDD
jgi:hypothetical protein